MNVVRCHCVPHQPAAACEVGKTLFVAMMQAWQQLLSTLLASSSTKEAWAAWVVARATYLDHVRGWQEGDLKVQRERARWVVSLRHQGRWLVWFGTREEGWLVEWLCSHHYQQFVQPDMHKHRIAGYYRHRTV